MADCLFWHQCYSPVCMPHSDSGSCLPPLTQPRSVQNSRLYVTCGHVAWASGIKGRNMDLFVLFVSCVFVSEYRE